MPQAPARRAASKSDVAKLVTLHHRRRGWAWVPVGSAIGLAVTEGYLSGSGADVIWGSQVPLGQPFSVRGPIWAWGRGRVILTGDAPAIANIIAGLFFDGVTLLLLYILVVMVRDAPSRRSQRMPVTAGADPGGVRRTPRPDRGHHGSGARRRARRRRGSH